MVFLKDEIKLTGALFRYVVNTADYLDLSEIFHPGVLQLRCWRLHWVIILFLHFKMHRAPACVGLSTGFFFLSTK